jgi:hypothetical protein
MGPLTGAWYIPVTKATGSSTATTSDDATVGLEEESEIREPEGRWKR